jgi:hypothetical protein
VVPQDVTLGIIGVLVVVLLREVLRLRDRVSRIEGRLNGDHEKPH